MFKSRYLIVCAAVLSANVAVADTSAKTQAVDNWLNDSLELSYKAQAACTNNMPKLNAKGGGVSYRVSVTNCHNNAGILTTGKYSTFFSWVARNSAGADRIPNQNCAVNSCSVAKVQKTLTGFLKGLAPKVKVWCLGTPGNSKLGRTFRRITGKQPAVTRNPATDIARYCIIPTQNKN